MSDIIPFEFETRPVRVALDERGEPWFVAADVCTALELPDTHKAVARLDADEKGRNSIPTPGGPQEMTVVSEAGLYALVLGSRKASAKRFKRWVTHEVLPSIRKTGGYSALAAQPTPPHLTQDRVNAILLIGQAVAKVPGVAPGIAMAATLTVIHENTGLCLDYLRRVLPVAELPLRRLNPTQLGERIGLSARTVNLRLQALGLQFKNERDEWELTEAGRAWAEALPYSRNGHSGYQILWDAAVVEQLKEVA